MLLYVRAEREREFGLHLYVSKQMLPFFAAEHFNYARYGLHYTNSMEKLPNEIFQSFMKREHVVCHKRGIWNSIWSDMMIEATYMKYGKGPGRIIGFTMQH